MEDASRNISVIVPSYNAEEYLSECLGSVLAQPETGEVVVVDDGSADGTLALAREWAGRDGRVRVLHQGNAGVSAARNAGMDAATLPWMCFVDADDVVPEGSLSALLSCAEANGADMAYGDFAALRDGEVVPWPDEFAAFRPGPILARDMVASLASTSRDSVSGSCCRVLFRTPFVKSTRQRFPEGIAMSEDYCFVLGCLMAAPKVAYVDQVVYLVRREGGSATQRYMPALERSMDYVNGVLRQECEGDSALMSSWWECVGNTAWAACGTLFKEGTPYDAAGRRREVGRVMRKYREAIGHVRLGGGLGRGKALALKVGAAWPWLLWAALEVRSGRSGVR